MVPPKLHGRVCIGFLVLHRRFPLGLPKLLRQFRIDPSEWYIRFCLVPPQISLLLDWGLSHKVFFLEHLRVLGFFKYLLVLSRVLSSYLWGHASLMLPTYMTKTVTKLPHNWQTPTPVTNPKRATHIWQTPIQTIINMMKNPVAKPIHIWQTSDKSKNSNLYMQAFP